MADTITKSVAARLAMDDYIKIITAAAELRMTVSDFLIMKIHAEDDRAALQAQQIRYQDALKKETDQGAQRLKQIDELKGQVAKLQTQLNASSVTQSSNVDKANGVARSWQQEAEKQAKTVEATVNEGNTWRRKHDAGERRINELMATLEVEVQKQTHYKKGYELVSKQHDSVLKQSDVCKKKYDDLVSKMSKMRSALADEYDAAIFSNPISKQCWAIIDSYLPQ